MAKPVHVERKKMPWGKSPPAGKATKKIRKGYAKFDGSFGGTNPRKRKGGTKPLKKK